MQPAHIRHGGLRCLRENIELPTMPHYCRGLSDTVKRRMKLWKDGQVDKLIEEAKTIQRQISNIKSAPSREKRSDKALPDQILYCSIPSIKILSGSAHYAPTGQLDFQVLMLLVGIRCACLFETPQTNCATHWPVALDLSKLSLLIQQR